MKDSNEIKLNVGSASLILIVLVFALSAFSLLSIRSSQSELKLAQKTADSIRAYYLADSSAEEELARRVEAVKLQNMSSSEQFQVSISDTAYLDIILEISPQYPSGYQITKWKYTVEQLGDYEMEILD